MTGLGVIALILLQCLIGWGVLRLLKLQLPPIQELGISCMVGMGIGATIPLLLEVFSLPIEAFYIILLHVLFAAASNLPHNFSLDRMKVYVAKGTYQLSIAELFPIVVLIILLLPAYWACYYLPPVALDFIRGPAVLAKYAIEEGTIISTVFTENVVYAGTNLYKPPFLLGQEINYQSVGLVFGKLWHVPLHLSFIIVMYNILRNRIHGVIAGILLVLWVAIPEQYAHLYFILHDLPNAMYLCLILYFLMRFMEDKSMPFFWLSLVLSVLATLLRAEHLLFIGLASIVFLVKGWKSFGMKYWLYNAIWLVGPLLIYVLWMQGFVAYLMPESIDVVEELNFAGFSMTSLLGQFGAIFSSLVTSEFAHRVFLNYWYLLPLLILANLIFYRSLKGWEWLVWILTIWIGYALMLELIPLVVLENTVKRGFFKILALVLMYAAFSKTLPALGQKLKNWEATLGSKKTEVE